MKKIRPIIKNRSKLRVVGRYLKNSKEFRDYIEKINPVFYEVSSLDWYVQKFVNEEVKKTIEMYDGLEITIDDINEEKYKFYIENQEGEPVLWMKIEDERVKFSKIPVELS